MFLKRLMVVMTMKLADVLKKLRHKNKVDYKQIQFCLTFGIFLISSFFATIMNTSIQNGLPEGGDSLKQIYMIFSASLIGAYVFILYSTSLFLRYKSREIGVFLALGTEKKRLTGALYGELLIITAKCGALGIFLGSIFSVVLLKICEFMFPYTFGAVSIVTFNGFFGSLIFAISVGICVMIKAILFMKKTNIMDILNQHRKSEPIKVNVSKKYLVLSYLYFFGGIFVALMFPMIYLTLTKQWLGLWPNVFFLVALVGIYRILTYSISVHTRGRNPQKYYNNIISYGLLKFQGKSFVQNMLVVSLLIFCSLYAIMYSPQTYMTLKISIANAEHDFSLYYPQDAEQVTQESIHSLADEYEVSITNFQEVELIRLLGSGTRREDIDENNRLIEIYEKEHVYYAFISETAYQEFTGKQVEVAPGTYLFIKAEGAHNSIFQSDENLDYVKNPYTEEGIPLAFAGIEVRGSLVIDRGHDGHARFIISDEDYEKMNKELPAEMKFTQFFFDVEEPDASFEFAKALYKEFVEKSPDSMLRRGSYDEQDEITIMERDGEYYYNTPVIINGDHPEITPDWKYWPSFRILRDQYAFNSLAVYLLVFIYVSIICLASVWIISYSRSITLATRNKQVFDDIKKLGANNAYIHRILSSQIKKVYTLPTIVGIVMMMFFYTLMLWQNDGFFDNGDALLVGVLAGLCVCVSVFQYVGYKVSMKSAVKLVLGDWTSKKN